MPSPSKKTTTVILSAITLTVLFAAPALSQGCNLGGTPETTLRTPLIPGAPSEQPFSEAPPGQPPPIGDGSTPAPVTPGMPGPPTLIPSIPITPANDIDHPSYRIGVDPAEQSFPGEYGPTTWAPPPPSTPGSDPGILHAPLDFYPPPARVVHINPGGGISGSAPTQRWGGQTSRDFGRYKYIGKRSFDFAQEMNGSTSEDGPWQTLPGAVPTQDLYGRRCPRRTGEPQIQTIAPY